MATRALEHFGPRRVERDIAGQFPQITPALDENGFEAALEDLADACAAAVEALGVDAVELPPARRQIALWRLDKEAAD